MQNSDKNIIVFGRQVFKHYASSKVCNRNAENIAKEFACDINLYHFHKTDFAKKYDAIIVTYFNRYTDYTTLKKLIKNEQKRFLIRTEYEEVSVSMKEYKPYIEIGNFEGCEYFLNLNLLISRPANKLTAKKYDCIYYSRHRADRMIYCKEYLQGDIYLSTHPKNHKHFYHAGCRPKLIKHIDWTEGRETLNQFRYSLYMEDKYTHSVFNNLANRWYEAGFCNVVMFFDINCKNTVEKSEIGPYFDPYYFVSNHAELMQKIEECNKDWGKHLDIQKSWRKDEWRLREEMIEDLKQIIYSD